MPLVQTRYEHVVLDDHNVPIIAGTTTKVADLALDRMAYGWSPEELQYQHPTLTLGQIHSALAYYCDHQAVMDQEIERGLALVDRLRREMGLSPLVARLKSRGLI